MELLRLESPAEIFAVDLDYEGESQRTANRLKTIHGVPVPGTRRTPFNARNSRRALTHSYTRGDVLIISQLPHDVERIHAYVDPE